jgi:hypothetical protein
VRDTVGSTSSAAMFFQPMLRNSKGQRQNGVFEHRFNIASD